MKDDGFESKYMQDGSKILHRDKRVSRKMALLLSAAGLFVLFQAISLPFFNESSTRPMPESVLPFWVVGMGLFGLAFFVLAVVLGVVRFVVTERAIHVKYGLWGPTIPLDSVVSCKVVPYDWLAYGGWGIRRGIDGSWAYVPGTGSVVEIAYRDGNKERKVVLGAQDPHALARSIDEATASGAARMRVASEASAAPEPQDAEPVEDEVEREPSSARTLARRRD